MSDETEIKEEEVTTTSTSDTIKESVADSVSSALDTATTEIKETLKNNTLSTWQKVGYIVLLVVALGLGAFFGEDGVATINWLISLFQ